MNRYKNKIKSVALMALLASLTAFSAGCYYYDYDGHHYRDYYGRRWDGRYYDMRYDWRYGRYYDNRYSWRYRDRDHYYD